ncbi:hypothetical protein [Lysobacter sp. A3-1-A15]|uniref:hypothetical protein n=1 Tax=Novilysobacter viscosus TaxID=3098602 RepID=UPI002EDBB73A
MQRRTIQLPALVATVLTALLCASPSWAEPADATMAVGLRIVAAVEPLARPDRSDTAHATDGRLAVHRTPEGPHGPGPRAHLERVQDAAGRHIEVVTY